MYLAYFNFGLCTLWVSQENSNIGKVCKFEVIKLNGYITK